MKTKTKRKIYIGLFVLVCLAVIVPLVLNALIGSMIHRRIEVIVPDVHQKHYRIAQTILEENHLSLVIAGETFESTVSPGGVVSQDPAAGSVVREGREVHVMVSKGGNIIEIPDVVGMPQTAAEVMIRNIGGCVVLGEPAYSLYTREGYIARQTPPVNTFVERGTDVTLIISKGSPPQEQNIIIVPRLIGKSQKDAEALLQQCTIGSTVEIRPAKENEQRGAVVEQSIESDTTIPAGTSVTIVVAQ